MRNISCGENQCLCVAFWAWHKRFNETFNASGKRSPLSDPHLQTWKARQNCMDLCVCLLEVYKKWRGVQRQLGGACGVSSDWAWLHGSGGRVVWLFLWVWGCPQQTAFTGPQVCQQRWRSFTQNHKQIYECQQLIHVWWFYSWHSNCWINLKWNITVLIPESLSFMSKTSVRSRNHLN